jgi:hypothetical protein
MKTVLLQGFKIRKRWGSLIAYEMTARGVFFSRSTLAIVWRSECIPLRFFKVGI